MAIDAEKMVKDGFKFFLSPNGVFLTDFVPPEYIVTEAHIKAYRQIVDFTIAEYGREDCLKYLNSINKDNLATKQVIDGKTVVNLSPDVSTDNFTDWLNKRSKKNITFIELPEVWTSNH